MLRSFCQAAVILFFIIAFNLTPAVAFQRHVPDESFKVSYQYTKVEGATTRIFPVSTYLDDLRRGQINSAHWRPCCRGFFKWHFPELSVKVANSTRLVEYLSEIILTVSKSELNEDPVLIFEKRFMGRLAIVNEGWGPVINPSLDFTLEVSGNQTQIAKISKRVSLATFDTGTSIDFSEFLDSQYHENPSRLWRLSGFVAGEFYYSNKKGQIKALKLESPINFGPPPAPFVPPSPVVYDVHLPAGIAPYIARVPISQVVGAGDVDHFLVRVASDRSARFDFAVELRTVAGRLIPAGKFELDMFVPRSGAKAAVARNAEKDASE